MIILSLHTTSFQTKQVSIYHNAKHKEKDIIIKKNIPPSNHIINNDNISQKNCKIYIYLYYCKIMIGYNMLLSRISNSY